MLESLKKSRSRELVNLANAFSDSLYLFHRDFPGSDVSVLRAMSQRLVEECDELFYRVEEEEKKWQGGGR